MPDDDTIESLQARLTAARAELDGAKARITQVNDEAKGHRLAGDNARREAERLAAERDAAVADAAKKVSEAEAAAIAKTKEADAKVAEALTAGQKQAVEADLKVAAKDAGAQDVADVLALLDRSKVKTGEGGDVQNAAELMAELKKAKPYLFGAASTSSTATPPPSTPPAAKPVKDMTDAEFDEAYKRRAWRS